MPSQDKTGPDGQGPMTGRKADKCTGNAMLTSSNFHKKHHQGRNQSKTISHKRQRRKKLRNHSTQVEE